MSVYGDAASGYRDTTKWLTAFLPVTAIVTAGVTLGPPLADSARRASGIGDFLSDTSVVLIAALIGLVGLIVVVVSAARVLSVDPTDIGTLYADKKAGPQLVQALGAGALAPYFLDQPSFDEALTALSAAQAADDNTAAKPLLDRLEPACEVLRQWAVFRVMRGRFACFLIWFGVGSVVVTASLVVAASQLSDATAIDKPVAVKVEVDDSAGADLRAATGCIDPATVNFVAVGGIWAAPVLAVSGPGCTTAARWSPDLKHVVVAPSG